MFETLSQTQSLAESQYDALESRIYDSSKELVATFKGEFGNGAVFISIGQRDSQQDRIILTNSQGIQRFAVVDGMGGVGIANDAGAIAADIVAQIILEKSTELSTSEIQQLASEQMRERVVQEPRLKKITNNLDEDRSSMGACFGTFQVIRGVDARMVVKVQYAGDVRLVAFDQDGEVIDKTKDQSKLFRVGSMQVEWVTNSISDLESGETAEKEIILPNTKCRIIFASDGLWGCFKDSQEVMQYIKDVPDSKHAVELLKLAIRERKGRDNISIIIYDVGPEAIGPNSPL